METINKMLIGLVALALLVCAFITYSFTNQNKEFINQNKAKSILTNEAVGDKDVLINPPKPPHPYNECIKLIIDQSNKENKEWDFDKAKSVCFELIKDRQIQDKQ